MAAGVRTLSGTIVLDCEGLSQLADGGPKLLSKIEVARTHKTPVVVSAMTVVEAQQRKLRRDQLDWVISRLQVEPVTLDIAKRAVALLRTAGMQGHAHAIDAVVAATALEQRRPVALYTSDPGDLGKLCDEPGQPQAAAVVVLKV